MKTIIEKVKIAIIITRTFIKKPIYVFFVLFCFSYLYFTPSTKWITHPISETKVEETKVEGTKIEGTLVGGQPVTGTKDEGQPVKETKPTDSTTESIPERPVPFVPFVPTITYSRPPVVPRVPRYTHELPPAFYMRYRTKDEESQIIQTSYGSFIVFTDNYHSAQEQIKRLGLHVPVGQNIDPNLIPINQRLEGCSIRRPMPRPRRYTDDIYSSSDTDDGRPGPSGYGFPRRPASPVPPVPRSAKHPLPRSSSESSLLRVTPPAPSLPRSSSESSLPRVLTPSSSVASTPEPPSPRFSSYEPSSSGSPSPRSSSSETSSPRSSSPEPLSPRSSTSEPPSPRSSSEPSSPRSSSGSSSHEPFSFGYVIPEPPSFGYVTPEPSSPRSSSEDSPRPEGVHKDLRDLKGKETQALDTLYEDSIREAKAQFQVLLKEEYHGSSLCASNLRIIKLEEPSERMICGFDVEKSPYYVGIGFLTRNPKGILLSPTSILKDNPIFKKQYIIPFKRPIVLNKNNVYEIQDSKEFIKSLPQSSIHDLRTILFQFKDKQSKESNKDYGKRVKNNEKNPQTEGKIKQQEKDKLKQKDHDNLQKYDSNNE